MNPEFLFPSVTDLANKLTNANILKRVSVSIINLQGREERDKVFRRVSNGHIFSKKLVLKGEFSVKHRGGAAGFRVVPVQAGLETRLDGSSVW